MFFSRLFLHRFLSVEVIYRWCFENLIKFHWIFVGAAVKTFPFVFNANSEEIMKITLDYWISIWLPRMKYDITCDANESAIDWQYRKWFAIKDVGYVAGSCRPTYEIIYRNLHFHFCCCSCRLLVLFAHRTVWRWRFLTFMTTLSIWSALMVWSEISEKVNDTRMFASTCAKPHTTKKEREKKTEEKRNLWHAKL